MTDPVTTPKVAGDSERMGEPRVFRRRGANALLKELRAWIGLRRGVRVGGFYYKELTAEPLERALGEGGSGFKDYRVTFPDGSKQVIRCGAERVFADLMGTGGVEGGLARVQRIAAEIRPGMRVLHVGAGDGHVTDWLAEMVGRSGEVVALERDEMCLAYAQKRYGRANVAFEGETDRALVGELDGAFDGVVVIGRADAGEATELNMGEWWRVMRVGGWMLVGRPSEAGRALEEAVGRVCVETAEVGAKVTVISRTEDGVLDVLVRKVAVEDGEGMDGRR